MGYPGRTGLRRARRYATALPLALLLAVVVCAPACASGDDDSEVATPPLDTATTAPLGSTTAPPCARARHAVAFDFLGTLTPETDLAAAAAANLEVPARSGAADVATAYRDRGYEILYVSTAPANFPVGDDQPLVDVMTMWLGRNGFPTGDGTRIWTWDEGGDAIVALVEELLRLEQANVTLDAAYTDDADKAHAMASGGVPPTGLWTLGAGAGTPGSTAVPDDDLVAHVATVERLGMICQP
jgi:hypothetical protein